MSVGLRTWGLWVVNSLGLKILPMEFGVGALR